MNVYNISENNKNEVLKTIILNKTLFSRADISRIIKLNKASVSRIINELINENIITELKKGDSTIKGGKKPLLIDVNHNNIFISVYLLKNKYRYFLTDIKGREIKTGKYKPKTETSFKKNLENFFIFLKKETTTYNPIAINMVIPGIVNSDKYEIIYSGEFDISIFNIKPLIQKHFNCYFFLENDANAAAVGYKFFENNTVSDFIFLLLRIDNIKSILYSGCGIMLNNKLIKGYNNYGGEFLLFKTDIDKTVILNGNYWKLKPLYEKQLLDKMTNHLFFLNPPVLVVSANIKYNTTNLLEKLKKEIKNIQNTYTGFTTDIKISEINEIPLYGGISILIDKLITNEISL